MRNNRFLYIDFFGIIGAIFLAIVMGFIIIFFVSDEPFQAISSFVYGPFSNMFHFSTVINKSIPLIFTGLSLAIVFQTNVFSMGAEGQLYVGAFVGSLTAVYLTGLPTWIIFIVILLTAFIGGMLFGAIPGILKAYWNANEVVTTLMLNYVAIIMTSYFVNNVFKDPESGGYARMEYFDDRLLLKQFSNDVPIHGGIFLALAAIVIVYLLLFKTKLGYAMRTVGMNQAFARYGGINTKLIIVISVVISGGLAGLGGIIELQGVHGTYKDNFSDQLGFDGIIIALLARNNPIGVFFAAIFYSYLKVGGQIMQSESDVARELAVIVQVILVIFVSALAIFNYFKQKAIVKKKNVPEVMDDVV